MPRSTIRLVVLHSRLERELLALRRMLRPDPAQVSRLKKLKLSVKDRLAARDTRFAR